MSVWDVGRGVLLSGLGESGPAVRPLSPQAGRQGGTRCLNTARWWLQAGSAPSHSTNVHDILPVSSSHGKYLHRAFPPSKQSTCVEEIPQDASCLEPKLARDRISCEAGAGNAKQRSEQENAVIHTWTRSTKILLSKHVSPLFK